VPFGDGIGCERRSAMGGRGPGAGLRAAGAGALHATARINHHLMYFERSTIETVYDRRAA
jgi:hypothetical protein